MIRINAQAEYKKESSWALAKMLHRNLSLINTLFISQIFMMDQCMTHSVLETQHNIE